MNGGEFPGAADRQQNYRFWDPNPWPGGLLANTIKEAKVVWLGDLGSSFQFCVCYFREKQLSSNMITRQQPKSCG